MKTDLVNGFQIAVMHLLLNANFWKKKTILILFDLNHQIYKSRKFIVNVSVEIAVSLLIFTYIYMLTLVNKNQVTCIEN